MMKVICPLGSECEEKKDGETTRCAWYTKLVGKDPQSTKEFDEWGCAMAFLPVLLVENAQMARSTRVVLEDVRDESKAFNTLITEHSKRQIP